MQSQTCNFVWTNEGNTQYLHRYIKPARNLSWVSFKQKVWESQWIYNEVPSQTQGLLLVNNQPCPNLLGCWDWLFGIRKVLFSSPDNVGYDNHSADHWSPSMVGQRRCCGKSKYDQSDKTKKARRQKLNEKLRETSAVLMIWVAATGLQHGHSLKPELKECWYREETKTMILWKNNLSPNGP